MKCKFRKKCELYKKDSVTCNKMGGMKDDGEWYCGKAREFPVLELAFGPSHSGPLATINPRVVRDTGRAQRHHYRPSRSRGTRPDMAPTAGPPPMIVFPFRHASRTRPRDTILEYMPHERWSLGGSVDPTLRSLDLREGYGRPP